MNLNSSRAKVSKYIYQRDYPIYSFLAKVIVMETYDYSKDILNIDQLLLIISVFLKLYEVKS